MNTEERSNQHAEKKVSYLPFIFVVVVLGLIAWLLLHNFHNGGNMWTTNEDEKNHTEKKVFLIKNPAEIDTLVENFAYNNKENLSSNKEDSVLYDSLNPKWASFLNDAQVIKNNIDKNKGELTDKQRQNIYNLLNSLSQVKDSPIRPQ